VCERSIHIIGSSSRIAVSAAFVASALSHGCVGCLEKDDDEMEEA